MPTPEQRAKEQRDAEAQAAEKLKSAKLEDDLAKLAQLTPIKYDQCRKEEAKRLGVRTDTLDAEVAQLRGGISKDQSDDVVEEVEPWPEPVNGAALLNEVAQSFSKHVTLPPGACTAITLWSVGTYCMDAWRIWPKLLITSPEKRCGKTTLLEALEGVCYRSFLTASISASALFRCIEEWQPSLLIDEADTFAKDNDELNGIINAGHTKRTATVVRSEKVGDSFKPRKYKVWSPQVIAGIKSQRDTLHDRSIHIQMRRKLPGEDVERMPIDYFERRLTLRRKCLRWALDNMDDLKGAMPNVPNFGNDRAQDNWTPLFSIAALAGRNWPEKVKSAYKALAETDDDAGGIGPMILQDIKAIFDERRVERIWSDDLVEALIDLEERPWCEWKHGKPITKNSLSRLLKPFKVRSGDVRFGQTVKRGYKRENLEDVWKRYLPPPETPIQSATTLQASQDAGFSPNSKCYTNEDVAFQKRLKASQDKGCSIVADEKRVSGTGEKNPYLLAKEGE